jgi:hypothetical protein
LFTFEHRQGLAFANLPLRQTRGREQKDFAPAVEGRLWFAAPPVVFVQNRLVELRDELRGDRPDDPNPMLASVKGAGMRTRVRFSGS